MNMNASIRWLTILLVGWMALSGLRGLAAEHALDSVSRLAAVRQAKIVRGRPKSKDRRVARATVQTLLNWHYTGVRMTPQLSERWFQAFFDTLDYSHAYFLASDLEEFRSQAGAMMRSGGAPNLELAFQIYERFLQRMRAYVLFSAEELLKTPDFTVKESLPIYDDVRKIPWASDEAELKERWRKRVKDILLADRLNREEREAKASKTDKAGSPKMDIVERTRRSLATVFLRRLEADTEEVTALYVNALASLLDPHSVYLPPSSKESFDIHMRLSLQGIGATLSTRDSYTTIVSLVPGGPAARDGHLKPGDRIIAVAQSAEEEPLDVVDMPLDKVVQRIRGPKGTSVYLTVLPKGSSSEYVLKLVREEVLLKDSEAQSSIHEVKLPGGGNARVVMIYLPSFYSDFSGATGKSCSGDVAKLLRKAKAAGRVDGVVLDLRGNGGGSLDEAVRLCGLFLKGGGPVVQVRNQQGYLQSRKATADLFLYDGPLMVMVDRFSASASEIVAACLQDTGRALLVGDRSTHGKGSVQSLVDLANFPWQNPGLRLGGCVKVTIGKFYRINGASTQERGVTPDIVYPSFLEWMGTGEAKLPNVLPWDECQGARFRKLPAVPRLRASLREVAAKAMRENASFQRYAAEVERYRRLREQKSLPLELEARRAYRREERALSRQMLHFQPKRESDDRDALLDDDEEEEEKNAPREDVVLDVSMQVMARLIAELGGGAAK